MVVMYIPIGTTTLLRGLSDWRGCYVVMYIPIGTTTLLRGLSDMRLKGDGCYVHTHRNNDSVERSV